MSLPQLLPASSITILGPTACGKTELAVALARQLPGEIISVDSRQVYQELDIGSGKDRREYGSGDSAVKVHLLDVCDLSTEFSLFDFQRAAYGAIEAITRRQHRAILCGGSGLYLDCLLTGYSLREVPENELRRRELKKLSPTELEALYKRQIPTAHNTTDLVDPARMIRALEIHTQSDREKRQRGAAKHPGLVLGIELPRPELRARITRRLKARMEQGMLEECQALLEAGVSAQRLDRLGLEYRWLSRHLMDEISRDDMLAGLETAIHQFARRQLMWFRRMERQGLKIHWLAAGGNRSFPQVLEQAMACVQGHDGKSGRSAGIAGN